MAPMDTSPHLGLPLSCFCTAVGTLQLCGEGLLCLLCSSELRLNIIQPLLKRCRPIVLQIGT